MMDIEATLDTVEEQKQGLAKFWFGDLVHVRAILQRHAAMTKGYGLDKEWRPEPVDPQNALFIGWRYLADGHVSYDYDDGPQFRKMRTRLAAVIVFCPTRNPVYAPPEELTLVERGPIFTSTVHLGES